MISSPRNRSPVRPARVRKPHVAAQSRSYARLDRLDVRAPADIRLPGPAGSLFSEHIGHTIGDPRGRFDFADCTKAIGPGGIRREPCSGCVYNCIGAQRFWTAPVLVTQLERRGFAPFAFQLIEANAAYRR